ncbi:hypothetical protein ACJJTC_000971 [Scirpophaga incertulas]
MEIDTGTAISDIDEIPEQTYLHFAQEALLLDYEQIKKQTCKDPILGRVLNFVRDGWPEQCDISALKPYFNRKSEIYEKLGCLMWGYRSTDHCSTGESPSMLMMGRRLRTHLDLLKPDRHNKVLKSQIRQVEAAGGLDRKLEVGSDVWYRQYLKGEKWQPGSVSHSLGSTDYSIIDKNGNVIHRHIDQLRRRSRKSLACTVSSKLNDSNLGEPKFPKTLDTQPPQSSKVVVSPAPEQTPLVRRVAEREKEDKDCFLTPEKELTQPVDTVPNTSTSTPAPTQPRPIRKCRLVNVPKYKF